MSVPVESGEELDDHFTGLAVRLLHPYSSNNGLASLVLNRAVADCRMSMASSVLLVLDPSSRELAQRPHSLTCKIFDQAKSKDTGESLPTQLRSSSSEA